MEIKCTAKHTDLVNMVISEPRPPSNYHKCRVYNLLHEVPLCPPRSLALWLHNQGVVQYIINFKVITSFTRCPACTCIPSINMIGAIHAHSPSTAHKHTHAKLTEVSKTTGNRWPCSHLLSLNLLRC